MIGWVAAAVNGAENVGLNGAANVGFDGAETVGLNDVARTLRALAVEIGGLKTVVVVVSRDTGGM